MTHPLFFIALWIIALAIFAITLIGMVRLKNWPDRCVALAVAAAGFVALFFLLLRLFLVPFQMWNIARLAVAVSMFKGYRLYYPPDQGPIQNHIYGPIAAMAYLPAGLASTPTASLLIGGALAALWFYLPAIWLIWRCSPNASRLARCATVCIFALLVQQTGSLRVASSWIHADAPALGLAACALAILAKGKMNSRRAIVVSLLALSAVWTKQSVAPLLLALPCWIALRDGRKTCVKFCAILCAVGILFSAICFSAFGPRAMWFNMFVEPSHHPWQFGAGHVFHLLTIEAGIPFIALVIAILLRSPNGTTGSAKYPFLLPLGISIAMIPTAFLGWIKAGGGINNASYVTYFLVIAACSALAECESLRWEKSTAASRPGGRALLGLLSLFLAWWVWYPDGALPSEIHRVTHISNNVAETDFQFELQHPGQVYFPWDPLAPLMASGKLYHFDYGVKDRILAGFPPSNEHLHQWIPATAQYIALPPEPCATFVMQAQLPEFAHGHGSAIDELPGYVLVKRSSPR